ncbi:MAG: hypothetical protein ACREPN_05045 [Rudaea sp.]
MNAVILTGRTLAGFIDQHVWQQVAAIFQLDPDAFGSRVLQRCPIAVRETPDGDEAQKLRLRLNQCGAEVELVQTDGTKWQIERNGTVLGPVPLSFLALENATRRLPRETKVKRTTDSTWITLESAVAGDTATRVSLQRPPELAAALQAAPLPASPTASPLPPNPPPVAVSLPYQQPANNMGMGSMCPFDSPDNWWMHWAVLTGALFLIGILLVLCTGNSDWWLVISCASAFWVYLDATTHRVGKVEPARTNEDPSQAVNFANNYSAGLWAILILLLWIIALPYYLAKRRVLFTRASQYPVDAPARIPKLVALAAITLLPIPFILNYSDVPACDSSEAQTTLREIFSNKGITLTDISLMGQKRFDHGTETRECSANVSDGTGKMFIHYKISWADKGKGQYEVDLTD